MPTTHTLPGTPPPPRTGDAEPEQSITAGALTAAQADEYVRERTRAQVAASIAQCNSELAQWQQKDAAIHDAQLYIDAAKAQAKAIPITDKNDPNHLANEARREGLLQFQTEMQAMKDTWGKAQTYINAIQKRRDASTTYLNSMPPKPPALVGYPIPNPPQVSFGEQSINWPPPHVDPGDVIPDGT